MKRERKVTLYGTLHGDIWQPFTTCQKPVTVDLTAEARRYVSANGSGLIDAVKGATNDGDFRCARLTADSFVIIEHRDIEPYHGVSGHATTWTRRVEVIDLPSLADYVERDAFTYYEDY